MFPSLPTKELVVLDLLRSGNERYGLEMVKASKGELKRGTIYVTLNRMTEKGYVSSRQEKSPNDPGMPLRLYMITGAGQRVLRSADAAMTAWGQAGYA